MKRILAVGIVVLIGAAYFAGYWPERQRRVALEAEVAALRADRSTSRTQVAVARLLGQLLHATEAAAAMNYGEAQNLSSRFFDEVRAEVPRTEDPAMRATLESVQRTRDDVTAALARGDASVLGLLRQSQLQLRAALGYPVPATPAGR